MVGVDFRGFFGSLCRDSLLGLLVRSQELLAAPVGLLDRPPIGVGPDHLLRGRHEIGGEEVGILAATAGIAHHQLHRCLPTGGPPEHQLGGDQSLHQPSPDLAPAGSPGQVGVPGQLGGRGQPRAAAPGATSLTGPPWIRVFSPRGRVLSLRSVCANRRLYVRTMFSAPPPGLDHGLDQALALPQVEASVAGVGGQGLDHVSLPRVRFGLQDGPWPMGPVRVGATAATGLGGHAPADPASPVRRGAHRRSAATENRSAGKCDRLSPPRMPAVKGCLSWIVPSTRWGTSRSG